MRIRILLIAAVLLLGGAYAVYRLYAAGRAPRRVIFVTIDTLRADHLQAYGYPRPTSPFLSELAGRSVVFRNAFSASSHTAPSHASMFTGLYPFQHNLLANGDNMDPAIATAAKAFKSRGWRAVAFPAVDFLEHRFDFDLAPAKAPLAKTDATQRLLYRNAAEQADRVEQWLQSANPEQPFFIWLHLYDVHEWAGTDHLPKDFLEQFAPKDSKEEFIRYLEREHGTVRSSFKSHQDLLKAMQGYDAQLRFVDDQLRRLYQLMDARGLNQDAVWIVLSDHGEGLGSHSFLTHGEKIYQEQLHVPLLIHHPGQRRTAARNELVRTVDLFPTLLALAGGPPERFPGRQGASLSPLLGRRTAAPWPVTFSFAQRRPREESGPRSQWEEGELYSLQTLQAKYIHHTRADHEFFDLRTDPLELRNLGADETRKTGAAPFKAELDRLLADEPRPGSGFKRPELSPDTRKELETLGYL